MLKIKKSFSIRLGKLPLDKGSADTPHQAHEGGHELFRPAAARYRRRLMHFVFYLVAGAILAFISIFLPDSVVKWVGIPGIALIATAMLLFFTLPALRCPECGNHTNNGFDKFCPACGKDQLAISALRATHCNACGRNMGSYKYRNYPIRYCTHCGVLLDEHGV